MIVLVMGSGNVEMDIIKCDRGDQPIRGKFVLKVELFLLGFQDTICFTRYSDCACVGSGNVEMDIIRVTGVTNQSEVNLY